jgi:hypothetical protein
MYFELFINKLFDIDLDKYDSDNKIIKERRFREVLKMRSRWLRNVVLNKLA